MRALLTVSLVTLLAATALAQDASWQAGFAAVAITPEQPMWMSGYAARTAPAEGKETDLWAKAMALQSADGRKAVLVTLDLVGIDRDMSLEIATRIRDTHKLPREAIILSVSHTHCGPVVRSNLRTMYALNDEQSRRVDEYGERLPGLIAKAVDEAFAKLAPAKLSWGIGQAGFAVNRRENKEPDVPALRAAGKLKGPIDHDVPVLAVRDAKDKLIGVVFGYACHATTLAYQKWNGDYPGYAMIELEKKHPGAVAMFFAGCGADQNPLPRRTVELAKDYGQQLASAVNDVLSQPMTPLFPHWAGVYREIDLPLKEVPTREALIQDLMSDNRYIAARAKLLLQKLDQGSDLPATYPYPVQTWRLGRDLTLVALGGEVVVDYALRLKKELTPGKTWVMGYANDVMAYIPSLRVLNEGGYEGATSMIYYGLPSVWGPKVEELIVAEVHRQAKAVAAAQANPNEYLEFIRRQAAALRANDRPPGSLPEWEKERVALRTNLLAAWGGFPETPCPLQPKTLGTLKRNGYRVEKVIFQTLPDVWMTANAYVPDKPGKLPAILCVHGHWRGAKQDPTVQARCIGAAKLGFFVLVVDAFGAGERGVGKALGEYHGEMTAATLFPVGLPLSGLQVYENMRAVDYLRTRPEVDGERIGITGASGGGNQTMYAGGWDDRVQAVVPVCSVGNYQAYLGAACCMCEVVPGALTFTEEWGVLGLTAPRALMVVNATKDARQFSVEEAKKSLALVEPIFKRYDRTANLRHAIFESPHDYNQAMREAMYGWMTLHLKGEGDGSPIPEPEIKTEDPESLRCFPGDTRPDDWMTIPKFAAREGRQRLAAKSEPRSAAEWNATVKTARAFLMASGFDGGTLSGPLASHRQGETLTYSPEPGITLTARIEPGKTNDGPLTLVLNLEGAEAARASPLAAAVRSAGWPLATLDLRATGALAIPRERIGRAPDHNSAQWGLWIGRPLLGQWVVDVRRLLDALAQTDRTSPKDVIVIGEGSAGLVALAAAALDERITKIVAVDTLASYISDEPYVGQRLGVIVPGLLREVGDVAHLAALAAPRQVIIAGGVFGNGKPLTTDQLRETFRAASRVWELLQSDGKFTVLAEADPAAVLSALR
jgi:cephalosporin-C deacetylase-like acetyl esterase